MKTQQLVFFSKEVQKEAEDKPMLESYYDRLRSDKAQAGAAIGALSRRVLGNLPTIPRNMPLSSLGATIGDGEIGDAATAFGSGTAGRLLGSIADVAASEYLPGGRVYRRQLMDRGLGLGSVAGELSLQDRAFYNKRRRQKKQIDRIQKRKNSAKLKKLKND